MRIFDGFPIMWNLQDTDNDEVENLSCYRTKLIIETKYYIDRQRCKWYMLVLRDKFNKQLQMVIEIWVVLDNIL